MIRAARSSRVSLWLFHTNDFHGRLTPEQAARLGRLRSAHPDSLLLDAGDAISAGNLGCRIGGEPVLRRMSELGYDAMTIGNRESHPRREWFPKKLTGARFPLLCANLTARPGAPVPTQPWVILERAGIRVAVIGLTVPMFTRKMWSQALCDYLYESPLETARAVAGELRSRCDLLIVLSHLGLREDQTLAAAVPEIDLIVGGHTHANLAAPMCVGKSSILHTTAYGFYLGRALLERSAGAWRVAGWDRLLLREDSPRRSPAGAGTRDTETNQTTPVKEESRP
jgi:2',3'-cyclic-nucleotide 2'-phosphodiesterase (5'-nucleotidase family)